MTEHTTIWWALVSALVTNAALLGYYTYLVFKSSEKRIWAVIMSSDKTAPRVIQVDPTEKVLKVGKKAYFIGDAWIKIGNDSYLLYDVKGTDPINPLDMSDSRMDSDVCFAIINNEVIKSINRVENKGLFDFENPIVKWGLIIVGAIIAISVFGTA